MAPPANALVYRDASLSLDDVDYSNQHQKARLVPDTPIKTARTAVPDGVVQDIDSTAWTFELGGLQINHTSGLAKKLRDGSGDTVEVVLVPRVGTGQPNATFDVILLPAPFGGEQGEWMTLDLTLPVVGAPVFGTEA